MVLHNIGIEMSGNFKFLQREKPPKYQRGLELGGRETETKKDMNIDDLVSNIHLETGLGKTEIKMIVRALENSIQEALSENRIVRLEKLGNFYPSITSNIKPRNLTGRKVQQKVEKDRPKEDFFSIFRFREFLGV